VVLLAPLTPDAIKTRFNRAMPERRRKFREAFDEFSSKIFHEQDFQRKYPERVFRLAADELGIRLGMAEDGVAKLLDSGWRPSTANEIQVVFLASMGTLDLEEDPTSDLYAAAAKAYSDVGLPDPSVQQSVTYRLGDFNRRKSEACIANLETHIVKENNPIGPTIHNYGPSAQQFGDNNVANVAGNVNVDMRSIHQVINEVRDHLDEFPADKREEVSDYVAALAEEVERPEPRPARLRTTIGNIGRVAGEVGLKVITALTAGVVQGLKG
jgi:hypothetical protein